MSLEQHPIDQGYRARLEKLEVAPPAHAWAMIAAQLPNKNSDEKGFWWLGSGSAFAKTPEEKSKRERVIFWWWTGAILALAALSLLAYFSLNASTTDNSPTPEPSSTTILPIATRANAKNTFDTSLEIEDDCPDEPVINSTATVSNSTALIDSKTKKSNSNSFLNQSQSGYPTTHRKLDQLASASTALNTAVEKSKIQGSLFTDTKIKSIPTEIDPVGLSIAAIPTQSLPLPVLSLLETDDSKLPFGPGVGCPDFNNSANWSFAVRAFAGPGTIFQEYTSTAQTAAYATLRDSIETKQLSLHAGLRFEAVNDRGLFLRAGADYQMYRSSIEYLGPRMSRTIIDSVFMEDTQTWRVETRNESFQEQRTVYNRHHAIVLTAGVGLRKTFGNVSPYIMAEGGYELLFKRKGSLVLSDGNFVDLAEDDQGLYINDRPGFQFGGVVGVDFALTDRIELGISGHYKQLGGLRGSSDLLDYKQSTAFGALNLRYTLR